MNKTLIRAAAVITLVAASITFFACSGEDGSPGKTPQCTSAAATGGINIICDGQLVGFLSNGQDGQGVPSTGCYLQQATVGYDVICGGVPVGNVGGSTGPSGGGCSVSTTQGNPYFDFTCPGGAEYKLAKAVCNYTNNSQDSSRVYDPDVQMCITSNQGSNTIAANGVKSSCDGVPISLETEFCRKQTASATTRVVFTRCGVEYLKKEDGSYETNEDGTNKIDPSKSGEYDPETQFCKISSVSNAIKDQSYVSGGVIASLCAGTNKYTTGDFCFSSKIYQLCTPVSTPPTTTGQYNPETEFCQTNDGAAQTPLTGTAVTRGTVKPRCGVSTPFGSLGKGSYSPDDFCYPATGGANSKAYIKCYSGTSTANAVTATVAALNSNLAADGTTRTGEYNPITSYCQLTVTVAYDGASDPVVEAAYTALVEPLSDDCGAVKYDPTLYECVSSQLRAICGTYTATSFCDEREVVKPNAAASIVKTARDQVSKATGGKQYESVVIGSQTWMAQNLEYGKTTPFQYDWASATEACPDGWHLPSVAEWDLLAANSTTNPARELRGTASENFGDVGLPITGNGFDAVDALILSVQSPNNTSANPAVLTIVPGSGTATTGIGMPDSKKYAFWWTSDEDPASEVNGNKNDAFFKYFFDTDVVVKQGGGVKLANSLQVRCVKD